MWYTGISISFVLQSECEIKNFYYCPYLKNVMNKLCLLDSQNQNVVKSYLKVKYIFMIRECKLFLSHVQHKRFSISFDIIIDLIYHIPITSSKQTKELKSFSRRNHRKMIYSTWINLSAHIGFRVLCSLCFWRKCKLIYP